MTEPRTSTVDGRSPSRRAGTAAIECAVVLPALLTLILGVVDFGRVFHASISLAGAVRAGADHAGTNRFTSETYDAWVAATCEQVGEELSADPAFDLALLETSVSTESVGGDLRVTAVATYEFTTIVAWPGMPSTVTLRESAVTGQYR